MKTLVSIVFTFVFLIVGKSNAQKISVNFVTTGFHGDVHVFDPAVNYDPKNFISIVHLNKNGAGIYTANLSKPRYVVFWFSDDYYSIFLSPGDDLSFKAQFTKNGVAVIISGKGSNNNQPAIFQLTNIDLNQFKDDKTPDRVIATIKSQEARNSIILKQYIEQYKPSADFIKNMQMNIQYFALNNYYGFYHNTHSPYNSTPYDKQWQGIEDSLLSKHKLNNEEALSSYNYDQLIITFLMRKGELAEHKEEPQHPLTFYRDWYHTTAAKGRKIYANESRNIFFERIIKKHFSGKSAEYLYAELFRQHFRFSDYKNLDLMFEHFKQMYPSSQYIPIFSNAMAQIVDKQKQTLNSTMIFVADDGTKLNSLEDVLKIMKGKTVFVDMWGTWCDPCREEIEKFSPQIRDHFKGKNVLFLYIDNMDLNRKNEWKRLIAYYKIEGTHILANQNLNKDIMTKLKSTGYPTHFIIKKDGTFKKTKVQDESNMQSIIEEIEAEM